MGKMLKMDDLRCLQRKDAGAGWGSIPDRRSFSYVLAFLLTLLTVAAFYTPFLISDKFLYFSSDGAVSYFTFKWVYNSFLHGASLPIWNFQNMFGQPMEYSYISIGASKYIAIFLGYIFHIESVWLLYIFSLLIELVTLVTGIFLIARHFHFHALTAFAGASILAVSTYWNVHVYFMHQYIVSFPVLFYFAIRFAETLDFRLIAGAALFMVIVFFNGVTYMPLMYFYQFVLLAATLVLLLRSYRFIGNVSHHIFNPWTLFMFAGSLALAVIFAYMLKDLLDGDLLSYRNGRNLGSEVSLSQFAAQNQVGPYYFYSFFGIHSAHSDTLRYDPVMGPFLLFFFVFAAVGAACRRWFPYRPYVVALVIIALLNIFATQGNDFVAIRLFYFLPGFEVYRFGMGFFAVAVVAAVIVGMIGLDIFLRWRGLRYALAKPGYLVFMAIFVGAVILLDNVATPLIPVFPDKAVMVRRAFMIVIAFSFLVFALGFWRWPEGALWDKIDHNIRQFSLLILIVGNVAVTWLSFAHENPTYYRPGTIPLAVKEKLEFTFSAADMSFPSRRSDDIYTKLQFPYTPYAANLPKFIRPNVQATIDPTFDFDSLIAVEYTSMNSLFLSGENIFTCLPWLDSVTVTPRVETFFRKFGKFDTQYVRGLVLGFTGPEYRAAGWIETTPAARRLLGCSANMARFADNVAVVASVNDATSILMETEGARDVIVAVDDVERLKKISGEQVVGSIDGERFWGNEISFVARNYSAQPAWVVISDGYSDDWTAQIDGKEVPIYPANLSFKGVLVPVGDSRVVLRFNDWGALFRIWVVALSLPILMFAFAFWAFKVIFSQACYMKYDPERGKPLQKK